ncbi:hypothetical protein M569_08837, partial [Genlisea aurea]
VMDKDEEELGSPNWGASLLVQTTEDVARAVAAAAAAVRSPRPSVVYSSKDETGSQLKRLKNQVSRMIKGLSSPSAANGVCYNPEILTSQKRQWANFQVQLLNHRVWKEPSNLFESMVVVGLPPSSDILALQNLYFARKFEGSGRLRNAIGNNSRVEPHLEPQVLFVYPPEKQLPLKYKDLLSFCFPAGVEVNAVERTPSMSELNEILLGQEHLKQSDLSFVFRLQVADSSTLYGCCVLVEEMIQKRSGLITVLDSQPFCTSRSRFFLTTQRCYCILSRVPFFELHFGVLYSIFAQERLERLTQQVENMDLVESPLGIDAAEMSEEGADNLAPADVTDVAHIVSGAPPALLTSSNSVSGSLNDDVSPCEFRNMNGDSYSKRCEEDGNFVFHNPEIQNIAFQEETKYIAKPSSERHTAKAILPLILHHQHESSESSSSFQCSSSEDRNFRSDLDEAETEEASSSGQEIFTGQSDILKWAKENNNGSLQIICEYYKLCIPKRDSTIRFHPLEHLQPLEYHRPDETVLSLGDLTMDLSSCSTSLEFAEVQNALMAEEEAAALSVWAVATLCGSLRLEHVLALFAGALLEKQIMVVCSNLGVLSAIILSIIPLIRPYQWQSLLMPVLPNDILDFLDAPVPYVVGVKKQGIDLQPKSTNVILVDVDRNQVKSPALPQLPQHRELYTWLTPYHSKLVGESYLAKRRPVYECTDVQAEAAKGFLGVLRTYLDSLCSSLRSHTITNVQSNNDKVSLLLKDSFIESFPSRNRPFMKLFSDTQLFSVRTDFVLSFFQKE